MTNAQAFTQIAPVIMHRPKGQRFYFDVSIGSICLSGADTGGAYCLVELSLAPGISVPRHMHTYEDEAFHVLSGELQVTIDNNVFVLKPGDTLMAPRNIHHSLQNTGTVENHYQVLYSPSQFEDFLRAVVIPAPDGAVAPTERQLRVDDPSIAVQNVHTLAEKYGIIFA